MLDERDYTCHTDRGSKRWKQEGKETVKRSDLSLRSETLHSIVIKYRVRSNGTIEFRYNQTRTTPEDSRFPWSIYERHLTRQTARKRVWYIKPK